MFSSLKLEDILPVIISIIVIILVAILEKQSKLVAAITATMPLTIALGLWIVYASAKGEREAVTQFNLSMLLSIFPTIGFLVAIWLGARAGLKLGALLILGYTVWGIGTLILFFMRRTLGV
ncbi:MAG: hypothetical protein PVF74_04790 [Anaerolineales bacterium]|jgi:hypothetical protein